MNKILIVALFSILGAALVKSASNKEEMIKEFMEYSEVCMNEKGATKADINDLVKKQPAANREAKCMRACIMQKFHLDNGNGKLDKAVAYEHGKLFCDGDAEKIKVAIAMVDVCAVIAVSDDICEAAEEYAECFKKQARAHGLKDDEF